MKETPPGPGQKPRFQHLRLNSEEEELIQLHVTATRGRLWCCGSCSGPLCTVSPD